MTGIAHLGVGLASKRIAPQVPVWILVVGAYAIDFLFMIFMIAGLEQLPNFGNPTLSPYSHGLLMAIVWLVLVGMVTLKAGNNINTGIFLSLLVFSHWIIDFTSHPMTFIDPNMTGLPLFFEGSPFIGLGLWNSMITVLIGEGLFLFLGVIVFIQLKRQEKSINKGFS